MGQTHTIGKTATTVKRGQDGSLRVTYHNTDVVSVTPGGIITLDTGGWFTVTTKTRMNQAASQFGLRYIVEQKNFEWFVRLPDENGKWKNKVIPFTGDSVTFTSGSAE